MASQWAMAIELQYMKSISCTRNVQQQDIQQYSRPNDVAGNRPQ